MPSKGEMQAAGGSGTTTAAAAAAAAPRDDELVQTGDMDEELEEDEVEAEEQYESSSSPSTTTSTLTWITWFCSLPGHEYFCEVAEDFIEDDFNLTGLNGLVPFYKEAMEMVLDVEAEDEGHRVPDVSIVESSAELLYGLIHQRYIITRQGLQQMYAKFDAGHFGTCPRVYCSQTKLVPCGRSDLPGVDTVKLYCPSCVDMYVPPSSRFQGVDGAFFGTTFPHLLFQTFPGAVSIAPPVPAPSSGPKEPTTPSTSLSKVYIPKIYGFKVSEKARSGPRMQWMRMRPRYEGEVDWTEADERGHDQDHSHEGEREHGAFDSGPDEEEDDEEDVSEDEAGKDGAAEAGKSAAARDTMQMDATEARGETDKQKTADTARPVRPLPRSSLSSTSGGLAQAAPERATNVARSSVAAAAGQTMSSESIKRDIEAAKALGSPIAKPAPAVLSGKRDATKGLVTAVKTIVA